MQKKKENFFKLIIIYFLDALQTGASQFTTNARSLKSKYWWKNLKVISNFQIINKD
jgi:hypothetical protein